MMIVLFSLNYDLIELTAENEGDKLLLAAKRVRRATGTDFVISLVADDFSWACSTYVGKLRQAFTSRSTMTVYPITPY